MTRNVKLDSVSRTQDVVRFSKHYPVGQNAVFTETKHLENTITDSIFAIASRVI